METVKELSIFNYDFEDLTFNTDMSNKLFCTFTSREELETLIEDIKNNYIVMYDKIFVLECEDQDEFICTYNVDFNNVGDFLNNTILVHRKKQTNTLYTINALNELIRDLNGGVLDKRFPINWNNYRNCILLVQSEGFNRINTKIREIIRL